MENVGEDSENVSRRKHRVSDVPCSRFQTQSWSYGDLMIQVTENCLELSKDEGIKNVRETSDMVGSSNGIHEMNRNKTIKTFPFLPCVLLA